MINKYTKNLEIVKNALKGKDYLFSLHYDPQFDVERFSLTSFENLGMEHVQVSGTDAKEMLKEFFEKKGKILKLIQLKEEAGL